MSNIISKKKIVVTLLALWILFISVEVLAAGTEAGSLSIDYAYLRKPSDFDNGTIHVYVKNKGKKGISITGVYLNGHLLQEEPDPGDISPWHYILPNPVYPGKVSDVMIKLARSTKELINIGVSTSEGKRIEQVIQPFDNPFKITYIGFNESLDKIYLYLKNDLKDKLNISKVYLDTEDLTEKTIFFARQIDPGEKGCIIIELDKPLIQGEYIACKVVTEEERTTEAVVRAFSFFPIGVESGSPPPDRNFDETQFTISYDDKTDSSATQQARYLLGCPIHILGKAVPGGRETIKRANEALRKDLYHPTYIHICRAGKERGFFLFGETADIIRVNPHQETSYHNPASDNPEHSTQWIVDLTKQGCQPRVVHVVIVATKNSPFYSNQFPTVNEIRLQVYYAISRGAKGIFYRNGGWNENPDLSSVLTGIGQINAELQTLRPLLQIGEPISLATCNEPKVEANSILAGNKAIVVILINHDNTGPSDKTSFDYTPKSNFTVSVQIPDWFKMGDVYEVVGSQTRKLDYKKNNNQIILTIDRLNLTKQIVLTNSPYK